MHRKATLKKNSLAKRGTRFLILMTFGTILIYQIELSNFAAHLRARMRGVVTTGKENFRNFSELKRVNASGESPGWNRLTQKRILIWNKPFNDISVAAEYFFVDSYPNDLNNLVINSPTCGRCKITYEQEEINKSDAVLFHCFYPTVNKTLPAKSYSQQLFVWWCQESSKIRPFYPELRKYFDLYMTSSSRSDVFSPYGSFWWTLKLLKSKEKGYDMLKDLAKLKQINLCSPDQVQFFRKMHHLNPLTAEASGNETQIEKLMKKKKRLALWIASNCHSGGGRLRRKFVSKIEKAGLGLDMLGKCFERPLSISRWDPAFFELVSEYKFYFSFENAIHCQDYFTEKLWLSALYSGTVPVIWGAHKDDIKHFLPPNSFIHTEDFFSAKDLVEYLEFLNKNDEEYRKFLQWRTWTKYLNEDGLYLPENLDKFPVGELPSIEVEVALRTYAVAKPIGFCNLCRKLNLPQEINKHITNVTDDRSECLNHSEATDTVSSMYHD